MIGNRLRAERERRGCTQADVAERLGTTRIAVIRWEKGAFRPTPYFRRKLADLYGKSIEELGLLSWHKDEQA